MTRPPITPKVQDPYPIYYSNRIIAGFGRGSAELGIPTANVPVDRVFDNLDTGIYFGWCLLSPADCSEHVEKTDHEREVNFNYGHNLTDDELTCLPMVMSVGWNPFYHNQEKAAEVHIMKEFKDTFYGADVSVVILGYIRPELNYTTKEALIEDIRLDIKTAEETLATPEYRKFQDTLMVQNKSKSKKA